MTATIFAITLGFIGLLSGLMGFSEDISKAHPKLNWVDSLPTKLIVLVIAFVGTLIATIDYNKRMDADAEKKLHNQDSVASVKLDQRDSSYRKHLDSINENTTEILARYGLKIDATKNEIEKASKLSSDNTSPIIDLQSHETSAFKYTKEGEYITMPIGLENTGNAVAHQIELTIIPTIREMGRWTSRPKSVVFTKAENQDLGIQISIMSKRDVSFYFSSFEKIYIPAIIKYRNQKNQLIIKKGIGIYYPSTNNFTTSSYDEEKDLYKYLQTIKFY